MQIFSEYDDSETGQVYDDLQWATTGSLNGRPEIDFDVYLCSINLRPNANSLQTLQSLKFGRLRPSRRT